MRAAQDQGYAVHASGLNFFEHLWYLCGFEQIMLGMGGNEAWARRMFARYAVDLVRTAEQVARTGATGASQHRRPRSTSRT